MTGTQGKLNTGRAMQRLTIIIPVKPPSEGKSRLAGSLTARQRCLLNLQLMGHTFDQVAGLADIANVRVVSRSAEVLSKALSRGFATSLEPQGLDLNGAISLGASDARASGADELAVLPIDLPWLSSDRLRTAICEFRAGSDVVIFTDRHRDGTNFLLWRPAATASFQYGSGSALRHAELARLSGLRTVLCHDLLLSFDLDTPQDLAEWRQCTKVDEATLERLVS